MELAPSPRASPKIRSNQLLLALVGSGGIPPDTRRVARALSITPDEANIAIHRLTALGVLAFEGPNRWRDVDGLGTAQADEFVRSIWRRAADAIHELDKGPGHEGTLDREVSMPDPVVQFQILSKDPEPTSHFYRTLFGWAIDAANALGYRQISTGRSGLPGGIWPAPPEAHPFVQLFVAVDDVSAAVDRARSLGARVIVPQQQLPDGDELAILADPEGLTFGLLRRREVNR